MNNRLAIYILSVVAIALGVVSCGRTGISKSVVMADSLSQSDPAAAMAFIDSITARNENMSTDSRMRLGLLRTKAQNSAGVMFTSDSVMRNIVEYYESEGDADDRMLAYYLMGSVYRDLGDSPLALQYFNKAAEQADTTSADCDYRLLCRIHGQAANLFLKQEIPYYALKEFAVAERYAMTAGDTLSALVFHEQRANAYYLLICLTRLRLSENTWRHYIHSMDILHMLRWLSGLWFIRCCAAKTIQLQKNIWIYTTDTSLPAVRIKWQKRGAMCTIHIREDIIWE